MDRRLSMSMWEVAAAVVTLPLMAVIAWLPAVATGAAALGVLAGLGAAAWFWGEDSRDRVDRDPLRPR